jgi:hypothetical protein
MAKEKPVAINQYFKETLNRLSTSINLADPLGLQMSDAFDKYVEKVIRPVYPAGSKIRKTSSVDDAAGMRYVDWSFRDANDKIATAVQAAVNNFVQGWGTQRGLLDVKGNPVPGQGAVPMQVSGITPQIFSGTRTRILNPRTAASVGGQAVRSGGTFSTDKNTGVSTWSVPDAALTWDGKNLTKSLRAQVREGDKRWLDGRVALSSLAEGASPATPEERAIAMNSRNFRVMLARHKAMTPEQSLEEFRLNLQRRRQQAQFQREYEESHPDDPAVKAVRDRARKVRNNRVKSMATSAIHRAIATLVGMVAMGIGTLVKILAGVSDVAEHVRKRQSDSLKYNLPASEMQVFTDIENSNFGLQKGSFANIFGNLMSFSDPAAKGFSSRIEGAASFLQRSTPDLLGFINGAVTHPDQMMYSLLADSMNITASRRGGVLQRNSVSEAASVNSNIIADLFGDAFGELFLRMYERLGGASIDGKTFTAAQIQENMAGTLARSPVLETPPVTTSAAERGVAALGELKSLWESIKHSIFSHMLAHMSELVALVRNIARTVIGAYNPAWAAAENAAAIAKAEEDKVRLTANIYGNEADLKPFMDKSKYTDSVEYTGEVLRIIDEKDAPAISRNLGLSPLEFATMAAINGFAMQNARKLAEIEENSDVTMGQLTHQTAHTGGTANSEMSNAALEAFHLSMYKFRNLLDTDTATMFPTRITGKGSILPYINDDYVVASIQHNEASKQLIAEANEAFSTGGYGKMMPAQEAPLSSFLPGMAAIIAKYPSVEQAVPELVEQGIGYVEIDAVSNFIRSNMQAASRPASAAARERYDDVERLLETLDAVKQYAGIPDHSPQGNRQAANMVQSASHIASTQLNEALVRENIIQQMQDRGFLRDTTLMLLKSSEGSVAPVPGTQNELRFEIDLKGLPDGKTARLTGTINNEGNIRNVQTWSNGGIDLNAVLKAYNPQEP